MLPNRDARSKAFDPRLRTGSWIPRQTRELPSVEPALRRAHPRRQPRLWAQIASIARIGVLGALAMQTPLPARAAGDQGASLGLGSLLLKHGDDAGREAPRLETRIEVRIRGVLSHVEIVQRFENRADDWVEGIYTFPLPTDAAVESLRMEVNGRVTVGEVREKQSAEAAYAAARERGQRASLVVQKRPNMFRTQVANIGPGESVEIAIGYTNLVEFDHGQYRTRIPLAMTPRYGAAEPLHPGDRAAQPDRIHPPFAVPDTTRSSVALSIDLDAGVAVAELMSLHHRIQTVDRGDRYEISLDGVDVAPDRDFELTWRSIVGAEPAPVVFVEEFAGASHALLTLLPPQEKRVVPLLRELIFVIDTSGSMQGDSIVQAKSALQQGLGSLRPGDAFNVIQFNSTTESLFAASIPFTPDNVLVAREYVDALVANGGTEMAPALAEAFRLPVRDGLLRQVVFITDGAVGNERSLFMLIENEKRAARLFTVGIGSAPNGHFMRSAARVGRGTHTFIGSGSQVAERMNELLTKLESPIVTDIRVDWPGQETAELAWRASGDLYAGEPLVIAARLPTAHAGLVTVSGRTAGSPWVRQIPLPAGDRDRIGIAGTWARMRVDEMLDAQRRGVADDEIRAQVLPLALEYQIVSPFTSLIAVEQQVARAPWMPMEKAQLAATIPHGSAMTLSSAPATATGVQRQLLLGLTLLVLGAFARARALRLAQ